MIKAFSIGFSIFFIVFQFSCDAVAQNTSYPAVSVIALGKSESDIKERIRSSCSNSFLKYIEYWKNVSRKNGHSYDGYNTMDDYFAQKKQFSYGFDRLTSIHVNVLIQDLIPLTIKRYNEAKNSRFLNQSQKEDFAIPAEFDICVMDQIASLATGETFNSLQTQPQVAAANPAPPPSTSAAITRADAQSIISMSAIHASLLPTMKTLPGEMRRPQEIWAVNRIVSGIEQLTPAAAATMNPEFVSRYKDGKKGCRNCVTPAIH